MTEPWIKYYTKEQLDIEIPNINLYDQIVNSKEKYPNNIAIEYLGKKITFKELVQFIDRAAQGLYNLGIRENDVVTFSLPNVPEVLICFYAINKIGGICNMTHPLISSSELNESIDKTNSKLVITMLDNYEKINSKNKIVIVNPTEFIGIDNNVYPDRENIILFKTLLDSKGSIENKKSDYNKIAAILPSGGTSGKSKHVLISNKTFLTHSLQQNIILRNVNVGESYLAISPNFHGFGLSTSMHIPLSLGCKTILVPKFDFTKFDELLEQTKPTVILGVPTLFEALIKSKNSDLDLSFVKYIISGGDNLSASLENKINKYLKDHNCNTNIVQGYGLTEALTSVSCCHDEIFKRGSIGIPVAGNHIQIMNKNNEVVPYGELGEICISGDVVMNGYLNDEEETNKVLKYHDERTWLHTGDLGYMDEDGFIYYKGRIKRMYISSGYNVYPQYVEDIIKQFKNVEDCCVVDVPHEYKKHVGIAYIILESKIDLEELKTYCDNNLAHYMIPQEFIVVDKFPKTKLGKINYKELQKIHRLEV